MAAILRGSNTNILRDKTDSNAGGSLVVLPAPGAAVITKLELHDIFCMTSSIKSSIGK
jgi:hypothetical protein